MKKYLKLLSNLFFLVLISFMVVLLFFLVKGRISGEEVPRVAGYELYVVVSGSMSPAFGTGSLVAVQPVTALEVREGDIITFRDPGDQKKIVTHRVLEVKEEGGSRAFVTKGDANDAPDAQPVPGQDVLGRVVLAVPYMGYAADFAKTKRGILLLLVVPGALLILSELFNLWRLLRQEEEEEEAKKAGPSGAGSGR